MIRTVTSAILSPMAVILLGTTVVGAALMTQVTIEPIPEPQIIYVEVTPPPTHTPSPTPSPSPTPTPSPSPSPTPDLLPSLPSLPPLPSILPSPPPLPSTPVCDRVTQGKHNGWANSGRECAGPNPHPALVLAVGLVIVALRYRR